MSDLFISHSLSNEVVADAVRSFLEDRNINCWKAPRDILPGQNWAEAIFTAISECKVFLLILSDRSQESEQVAKELALAANLKKIIIPLRVDECDPKGAFAYHLLGIQWHQARSDDLNACLASLGQRVNQLLQTEPVEQAPLKQEASEVDQQDINSNIEDELDELLISAIREQLSFLIPTTSRAGAQALFQEINTKALGASTCYLIANVSVSVRSSRWALICFCPSSLVVYLNDEAPVKINRDCLSATIAGDQRIQVQDILLLTKSLSKDDLSRLVLGINMWSLGYINEGDGFMVLSTKIIRNLLPDYERFAIFYPEVATMAEVQEELEEEGHIRREPFGLGDPVAEYYLDPSSQQGVYLYKDWIELHDGTCLQTIFIPLGGNLSCYTVLNEVRIELNEEVFSMLTKQNEVASAFSKVIRTWIFARNHLDELLNRRGD